MLYLVCSENIRLFSFDGTIILTQTILLVLVFVFGNVFGQEEFELIDALFVKDG